MENRHAVKLSTVLRKKNKMEHSDDGHIDLGLLESHGIGTSTVSVEVVDPNTFEYTFPTDDSLPVDGHFEVVSDLGVVGTQQNASLIVVDAQECHQSEDLQHQIELVFQSVQPVEPMQQVCIPVLEPDTAEVEISQQDQSISSPSKPKIERNKRAVPSQWKRNSNKMKRMKGQEYMGYQAVPDDYGDKVQTRFTEAQQKGSRVLGPPCLKHFSVSPKGFQCCSLSEDERKGLFNNFWNNMDWELKRMYISLSVEVDSTKRHTTSNGDQSKRQESWRYFIRKSPSETVRVCKEMFLSTFGVGTGMVRHWVKNSTITAPVPVPSSSSEGSVVDNIETMSSSDQSYLMEFIKSLPRLKDSGTSSICYLEPNLTSKLQVYKMYRSSCELDSIQPVNRATFYQMFSKSGIHFLPRKQGSCSTCKLYDNNQISPQEGRDHLNHEFQLRRELKQDKDHATNGRACVLMVGMDHVRQSPRVGNNDDSAAKSKLNVYNLVIYDVKTDTATCMWWNETNGELNPSTYASCLLHYLETMCTEKIPVVILSDVESGLNRNAIVANALLDYASRHGKIVVQKFAEKGHKLPECANVRKSIEKAAKGLDIYLPSDYERAMKSARKQPGTYNVWCISYDFFKDYSYVEKERYPTLHIFGVGQGEQAFCPVAENIRSLKYLPSGVMSFKTDLSDQWTVHPVTPKPVLDNLTWPHLYSEPLRLTEAKWRDLQDLKQLLPMDCRSFYDTLPH